ncbi:MAG TPA: carboxypeptidase-like regulatory domain-containing protein, partial [Candidatus Bathyarchaeia archaeon]|nr:carboxypeptidase-like regulatory domain-containing protein [Candidatus Bathyarchaeia archaeon]
FAFTNGTTHSLEVLTLTVSGTPSGARYLWDSKAAWTWHTLQYPNANMTTPLMIYNYTLPNDQFTAQFDKQFQYTLTFTDYNGAALSPAPASITLSGPTGALTTSAYSGQWLQAASWSVVDAKWEGIPGLVIGAQTIDLTNGPVTKSIQLAVYPASVKVVDLNNNPVSGANVTVTFAPPNSTSVSHLTGRQGTVGLGDIPLGPYTARVTYQGQDVKWSEDASATPGGVSTITLNISGTTSAPVVSAVVLLTIFGVALFLILLAIKVRKPPPPPTI